jgi:hypothetical protein
MIFRLSQKLSAKIKAGPLKAMPLDENPFADWSAASFVADRTQYILLTNTRSLYSVVMFGKGITNDSVFIDRAISNVRDFMEADGRIFVYQRFIIPAAGLVQFSKALNRSVTGSMNDLIYHAKFWLIERQAPPCDVGCHLNEMPMSAICIGGRPFAMPREAFKALAESIETR